MWQVIFRDFLYFLHSGSEEHEVLSFGSTCVFSKEAGPAAAGIRWGGGGGAGRLWG